MLGTIDKDDKIRIVFIRGISQKNPHFYRVIIGSNPRNISLNYKTKRIAFLSRINTMEALTSKNLNYFLECFNKHSKYILTYAILPKEMSQIEPVFTSVIIKHDLSVRFAWEIGPNDIDSVCIQSDDDVFIPEGQNDSPILKLLEYLKKDHKLEQ